MNTLLAIISIATPLCFGFSSSFTATSLWRHDDVSISPIKTSQHAIHQSNQSGDIETCVRLEASASFGIDPSSELPCLLHVISDVCNDYGVEFDRNSITNTFPSEPSKVVPGALGRALMIDVHGIATGVNIDENEFISEMKIDISQQIDDCLYCGELSQPVLLAFQSAATNNTPDSIIEKEVNDYGLRDGLDTSFYTQANEDDGISFIPSYHIKMDGAMIETVESPGQTHFDTSSILVFDNLLDDTLRKKLLNVVKGVPEDGEDTWRDSTDGPNPSRWVRGGLMDIVDNDSDSSEEEDGPCWGLTEEAIMDICFHDHPAINEFEAKLAQLFPDFLVSRLPEAVLGSCVSPLTANAPCHGDSFDFHIDADPMQVPPSPWADVFGRYPNRSKGKPRFVSVLLYLSDKWFADEWGAPTKFLDPPTQECYEVFPKPGRCLVMDQDISHTVVAPNEKCGKRPRYSLVWKLILHPKSVGQDMIDLSCGREKLWPTPQLIGSAIHH